jgi:ligand-binding sensor domain-containing protein
VGTSAGLYEVVGEEIVVSLSDKQVVDVTRDQFALWAVTAEDGLLYRDDNGWHDRALISDSSAFCGATRVVSAFDRTWVGTDHGLYVYNGYNWDVVDTTDFLFDSHVTALAPGKSYMYIGTRSEGVFAYSHLNGGIWPLDWSDDLPVEGLDIDNGRYLVAVAGQGALLKTRTEAIDVVELIRQTQAVLSALW